MRKSRVSSRPRISARLSFSSIVVYIVLLITCSFVVFIFSPKKIVDAEKYQLASDSEASGKLTDVQPRSAPFSYGFHPCTNPSSRYKVPTESDHYITVRSNGGLNQMRTGISDMVAISRIMNATLVIPELDKRSFWKDSSTFSDVFDEQHFIATLEGDVRIVKELPKELESAPRARKHFTSLSSAGYYEEMTHLWKDYKVIHVPKSDSRLANNNLPLDIQRLRCRALYYALRFSPPIESLGKKLVERLKSHGRYIALHLRYEKDMLSFTGCTYGLTEAEAAELTVMREKTNHWKMKKINSTEQRIGGNCPLTPKEVGIYLRALGYPRSIWIYIAAGEIFGGDIHLSELRSYFPNLVFKETLAKPEELETFSNHASQSAALDYIVCLESDVFIPSYSGNMARAVEGHRRFLGHQKTITPDRKGLVEIFDMMKRGELQEGSSLSLLISQMHKDRQGAPRKRLGSLPGVKGRGRLRTEESFYENPYPECICSSKYHAEIT
ncbi:O-fucosyltransferase 38 [Aristolochia californica]|uniref:O-fucosyltransferase 38 n=1 Tax=Aristolochia californica TaxID=171875 RepID=UPI0035DBD51E